MECAICLDSTNVTEYERRQSATLKQANRNLSPEAYKKTSLPMKLCETHRKEYDAIHGTSFMQ